MLRAVLLVLVLGLGVVLACDRTRADAGADALLHVTGGQFFREPMPADTQGPRVLSLTLGPAVAPGRTGQGAAGEGESTTRAFAFAIAGDVGFWVVPAGIPGVSATRSPTYDIDYAVAADIVPGNHDFVVRAVDAQQRFGPPLIKSFTITGRPLPEGRLVITLRWDNPANLDLHVVDPNGIEIFKRDLNSYAPGPPGTPREPPGTPHDGGVLDFDSNADCRYDGRSAESVIWTDPPPRGHYLVRVDTYSLCGEPVARWRAEAVLDGMRVASAQGIGTEQDTRFDHDRGAGVLAFELDVP